MRNSPEHMDKAPASVYRELLDSWRFLGLYGSPRGGHVLRQGRLVREPDATWGDQSSEQQRGAGARADLQA